jgi:Glycosyltransferases involved in cell wall biogenesis
MANKPKLISIVAPFYNESEGVDLFYQAITRLMDRLPSYSFEVVCVDDGSRDDTLVRLVALAEEDPRFQVVELSRNFGKESALTAGIDSARGDAIIPIDSDLQDPPELITELVREWEGGAEVVLARRTDRKSDSYLKRKTAELFYVAHNRISDVKIPDNVGDYRLMDKVAVDALKQLPERQRFMKGLFAWIGFRTVTVDYTRNARAAGTSKFSGWKLWNFALEGITSFSVAPLKIWTYVGGIGAIATLFYAIFIILTTLTRGIDVPGYASTLVAVLFFGSVQLISVGMLGEYLGRVYMETKKRPNYIIRKRYGSMPDSADRGAA